MPNDLKELPQPFQFLSQHSKTWTWGSFLMPSLGLVGLVLSALLSGSVHGILYYFLVVFSCVSWGLGLPSLVALLLVNVWDRSTESRLKVMEKSFEVVADTLAEKRMVMEGLPHLVDYKQIPRVVGDLAGPVLARALKIQKNNPIMSQFDLTLTALRLRKLEQKEGGREISGSVLEVKTESRWTALFTSDLPELYDIISPRFVTTYSAWNQPFFSKLVAQGFIEPFWPVPNAWVSAEDREKRKKQIHRLREESWFTKTEFFLGGGGQSLGEGKYWKPPPKDAGEALRDLLLECGVSEETLKPANDKDDKLEKLARETLCIWVPTPSSTNLAQQILRSAHAKQKEIVIEIVTTYSLWVKKQPNELLYRYEVPFSRPLFVKKISFILGGSLAKEWALDPPSVRSAFLLTKMVTDPKLQELTWELPGTSSYGTPFLPGHGVAFMWRKKSDKE